MPLPESQSDGQATPALAALQQPIADCAKGTVVVRGPAPSEFIS